MEGADRLQRKLKAIPARMKPALRAAVEAGAAEIVAAQRALVPKKSGKLAASIVYRMGDQAPERYAAVRSAPGQGDPELTAMLSAGNSAVRYAHLVEFGTAPHVQGGLFAGANPVVMSPGTQARPFFFPGYRLSRKRAKSRVARAVSKAAREAARG